MTLRSYAYQLCTKHTRSPHSKKTDNECRTWKVLRITNYFPAHSCEIEMRLSKTSLQMNSVFSKAHCSKVNSNFPSSSKDEVEAWKRPEDFNKAALEARHLIEMTDENEVLNYRFS